MQAKRRSTLRALSGVAGSSLKQDTKQTNRRSVAIPDYREDRSLVEPKAAYMPPLDVKADDEPSARRRSGSFPNPRRSQTMDEKSSRRRSEMPLGASKVTFDTERSSVARYSTASSSTRDTMNYEMGFRPGGRVVSMPPPLRSGAVSPISSRDISPVGLRHGAVSPLRNGAVSPIGRSSSPTNERISPASRDFIPSVPPRSQTGLDPKKQAALRQLHGLVVNTQMQRKRASTLGDGEQMQEGISMSPSARQPVQRSSKRASRTSMLLSATSNGDSPALDRIVEGEAKPFFGQKINLDDVLAMKLESVFEKL